MDGLIGMVAVNTSFFSEMLQSIADRSRAFLRCV